MRLVCEQKDRDLLVFCTLVKHSFEGINEEGLLTDEENDQSNYQYVTCVYNMKR